MTGRSITEIWKDLETPESTSLAALFGPDDHPWFAARFRLAADVPGLLDRLEEAEDRADLHRQTADRMAGLADDLKAQRDHWRFEARTLAEWKDEAADVLARALGYPSALENPTIPLGAVISLETAKQAAAELLRLRAQVEALESPLERTKAKSRLAVVRGMAENEAALGRSRTEGTN